MDEDSNCSSKETEFNRSRTNTEHPKESSADWNSNTTQESFLQQTRHSAKSEAYKRLPQKQVRVSMANYTSQGGTLSAEGVSWGKCIIAKGAVGGVVRSHCDAPKEICSPRSCTMTIPFLQRSQHLEISHAS
ncbi:hypothetical protein M758_UG219500 [Ceratodon purpureus]|nr:hypothetical protein M758_UG219500 [Ceratodon purpureus]